MFNKREYIHRHFLVIPFALMIASAPIAHSVFQATLSSVEVHSPIQQHAGIEYIAIDNARLDIGDNAVLQNGSVLAASEGFGSFKVSDAYSISLFHGAAHVSLYGDTVSVAALTAPVLVQDGDNHLVVPIGRQWRSSSVSIPSLDDGIDLWLSGTVTRPMPERFLRTQLQDMQHFSLHDSSLPEPRSRGSLFSLPKTLQLHAAQKHQEEVIIAQVRHAIEQNDADSLQSILADVSFLSQESIRHLSVLLSRSIDNSFVAIPLISVVGAQKDIWLLMSMHPEFSSLAWAYGQPTLDRFYKNTALFLLSTADIAPKSFGKLAVVQWGKMLEQFVIDSANPLPFLNAIIVHTKTALVHMEHSLYPERSRWYMQSITDVSRSYTDDLSVHAQKSLYAMHHWEDVLLSIPQEKQQKQMEQATIHTQSSTQLSVPSQLPSEEVEARAHGLLEDHHAVLTLETDISVSSPNTAQISNIVFSSVEKDRVFTFLLNVQNQSVSKLIEGEKEYPFTLPLDRFVSWAMR